MVQRSVARALLGLVFVALGLAAFVNATEPLAEVAPWLVLGALAVATLAALLRSPGVPACVGFSVFGWATFVPIAWLSETPPSERFVRSFAQYSLRGQRPGPLPMGYRESPSRDGTLAYYSPPREAGVTRDEYESGGSAFRAYERYNERLQASVRIGNLLTVLLVGWIGAAAGRWLDPGRSVPARSRPLRPDEV